MNDSSEATHYQIELTSRQVLTGLAVLLTCLFAAFFAGVWIGRNAASDQAALALAGVGEVSGADQQYDFFSRTTVPGAAPSGDEDDGATSGRPGRDEGDPTPAPASGSMPFDDGRAATPFDETDPEDDRFAGELEPLEPDPSLDDPVPVTRGAELPPPEEMGRGARRSAARAARDVEATDAEDPGSPRDERPAAVAAPAADGFTIQVLATSDRRKAEALVDRLVDADFSAFIAPSTEGGRTVYRVRVGPFRDRALATRQANELESRWGLDSWISPGTP